MLVSNYLVFATSAVEWGNSNIDYTHSSDTITVNTAGTYEITASVAYTTTTVRYNGILTIEKGGTNLAYGKSAMGYVRANSGHNDASLTITLPVVFAAGDTFKVRVDREAANGVVSTLSGEAYVYIKRMY